MLAKNLENKQVGNAVEYNVNHNSPIGSADCEPIIPQIIPLNETGATALESSTLRIGDRIKPKYLRVKGIVSLNVDNLPLAQRDIMVRVLILSQKGLTNGGSVLAGGVDTAHLLKTGYGQTAQNQVAFTGNTMDLAYPVNTEKFRVYMDKFIKLSPCAPAGTEAINRYSALWTYTFKQLPATLTFDEGTGDWPNNFAPFVCLGYAYSDGTAPDTVSTFVKSNIYTQFEFEDA